MAIGYTAIIALTDMNCVYPTPLRELWTNVPDETGELFRQMYPNTFEGGDTIVSRHFIKPVSGR